MMNLPVCTSVNMLIALALCVPCAGQHKYEREYTLKKRDVPEEASKFIADIFKGARVHWYVEESLTDTTIEAKLKSAGKTYSIEFSRSGKLQDVEVLIEFSRIPDHPRTTIISNLNKTFKNFKVIKTQTQWTGSKAKLATALTGDKLSTDIVTRYELIVKAKKTGPTTYYEVLCTDDGAIGHVREIVQRNADNLIY
jgi:hypothetical protein